MLGNYMRMACAVLLRRKFLTLVNLFGIVLTLSVLVVAAAVLEASLHPSGAAHRQDQILVVDSLCLEGKGFGGCTNPGVAFFERHIVPLRTPDKVSYATVRLPGVSYVDARKITVQLRRTDAAYWEILDYRVLEGRTIAADDLTQGRRVAVINAATAEAFFAGAPALGKSITVDSQTYEVIGVVANEPETSELAYADVWVPYTTIESPDYKEQWSSDGMIMLFAGKSGSRQAVQAELQQSLKNFVYPEDPGKYDRAIASAETGLSRTASRVLNGAPGAPGNISQFVAVAILLVLLFMLLPAINMANVNIGRILERAPEIGLRKATGASVRVLVGQFIFENIVLTALGGLLAFAIAPIVLHFLNDSVFTYGTLHVNLRVFLLGLALIVVFGFLSGVYPAWKMARLEPATALRGLKHV